MFLVDIFLFKINIENNRTISEVCPSGVLIVTFEYISQIVVVFPLVTLKKQILAGLVP